VEKEDTIDVKDRFLRHFPVNNLKLFDLIIKLNLKKCNSKTQIKKSKKER
jgi:hypothetical protein